MPITLLQGHISPETAYVVDDYPYGYTLRCKIRYWLEYVKGKGVRFWSQTTNPKKAGEVWNKPKASTYALFGGAMYLDEKGHVQWTCLTEYSDTKETVAWAKAYRDFTPPASVPALDSWVKMKEDYEAKKLAAQTNNPAAV